MPSWLFIWIARFVSGERLRKATPSECRWYGGIFMKVGDRRKSGRRWSPSPYNMCHIISHNLLRFSGRDQDVCRAQASAHRANSTRKQPFGAQKKSVLPPPPGGCHILRVCFRVFCYKIVNFNCYYVWSRHACLLGQSDA